MSGPLCSEALASLLATHGLDTVEGAFTFNDGRDMTIAGLGHRERRTLTLKDDQGTEHLLFMKRYGREPMKWTLERWYTYGMGGSPASVERDNILAAQRAGVETISGAYAGQEIDCLGAKRSYVVLTAVNGDALEQCFAPFLQRNAMDSEIVARFSRDVAHLVTKFHRAGFVHRDLYTSHIFMDESEGELSLSMIDLARMFKPRWRRVRWFVKDLAQLKFSMPDAWLDAYWDVFMDIYADDMDASLRASYESAIDAKIARIACHDTNKRRRRAAMEDGQK